MAFVLVAGGAAVAIAVVQIDKAIVAMAVVLIAAVVLEIVVLAAAVLTLSAKEWRLRPLLSKYALAPPFPPAPQ